MKDADRKAGKHAANIDNTGNAGIIALITDFGNKDYYAGVMKGVIKQIAPGVEIIDITHGIPSYDLLSAAFTVDQAYRFFPLGTIFVVVVDPGVGTGRELLLVEYSGRFFIGPNNGVLTPILDKEEKTVYVLDNENYFLIRGHSTFEGRDKMAPVAAYLSRGIATTEIAHLFQGNIILDAGYAPTLPPPPVSTNGGVIIEARILYIDQFGNVITNVNADFLFSTLENSGFSTFKVTINEKEITIFHDTYGQAGPGAELFMLIGSHHHLEIASNRQPAAAILNAETGQTVLIEGYRGKTRGKL